MNRDSLIVYLSAKPEAEIDFPFGPEPMVFKVCGKMFALVTVHQGRLALNLKCHPLEAVQLRDIWSDVIAGYHMNKRHWNTVFVEGSVPDSELERMIDHSYAMVVRGLRKVERTRLETHYSVAVVYCGE